MALPKIREQIEARVKDTGDTMTDILYINKASYPGVAFNNTTTGQRVTFSAWENSAVMQTCNVAGDTNNCRNLFLKNSNSVSGIANSLTLRDYVGGTSTEYKIYGEHNKPTAADVGAPTTTGGGATGTWGISINGSAATLSATLSVDKGGTGQTTARNAANAFMNALETGSSTPVDADYYISQYVGGGTTTTTYHRRPMSALWSYINGKVSASYPTKTGSGASGTWGISISGNAATATKLATARTIFGIGFDGTGNVAGKPLVYGAYTSIAANRFGSSGIEVRENGLVGSAQSDIGYAPSIGFHWSGRIAASLLFHSDGNFYLRKQDGTTRATLDANLNGNAATATKAIQDGNGATIASTYLKLAGGTMTGVISKAGTSSSWINGRNNALVRLNSYSAYSAITSMKTTNGSWEMGVYTNDNMWFTYASDANYNSDTNTVTQIQMSPAGALIVAINSDYTTYKARNIAANTSPLTSGSSSLSDGYIYVQYE